MIPVGWVRAGVVAVALATPLGCAVGQDPGEPADVRTDGGRNDGATPVDGAHTDTARPDYPDIWQEACDQHEFAIRRVIPDMLIVLDRSTSMFDEGYWNPVREAIYHVTAAMDRAIHFGLMIFPNIVPSGPVCSRTAGHCEPGREPSVPVGEGNAVAIRNALGPMVTCGGTPLALTLRNAQAYLDTLAANGNPKYILLATDGAPNCNPDLDGRTCVCTHPAGGCAVNNLNCLDDARTLAVIDAIRASGTGVYVLGIGSSEWQDILNRMALLGGTGTALFAEDPASILAAFEQIAASVATCEFDMRAPAPTADPTLVNFYFDDQIVLADHDGTCDNGWAWTDRTHRRVEFCGSYCDDLMNRRIGRVTATWGCPTVLR